MTTQDRADLKHRIAQALHDAHCEGDHRISEVPNHATRWEGDAEIVLRVIEARMALRVIEAKSRTSSASAKEGSRVKNKTTGETGTVLSSLQSGRIRVSVDINPEEWKNSVIGRPSLQTAVWERWNVTVI